VSKTILDAALEHAAQGHHVFPLVGKKPVFRGGFFEGTTDADQIRTWWKPKENSRNIGVRTGIESGIWALDVDKKPGGSNGFQTLQELTGDFEWLRGVPFQISATGGHFFFECDDADLHCSAGKVGPGIDVRANGGYIVVSPSIHPDTGLPYAWRNGRSILNSQVPRAPDWLVNLAKQPKNPVPTKPEEPLIFHSTAYGKQALAGECRKIEAAPNGQQAQALNDAAFRIGKLVGRGLINEFHAETELNCSASKMVNYDQKNRWSVSQIQRIISKGLSDGRSRS
jgi:hypothetical protein